VSLIHDVRVAGKNGDGVRVGVERSLARCEIRAAVRGLPQTAAAAGPHGAPRRATNENVVGVAGIDGYGHVVEALPAAEPTGRGDLRPGGSIVGLAQRAALASAGATGHSLVQG